MAKKGIEGLYSAIIARIKENEDDNRLACSVGLLVDEVKSDVDIMSVPINWYVDFAIKAYVESALNQQGYRSVVKGDGIFVNPAYCDKPEYTKKLFNNAHLTEQQKAGVANMLKKRMIEVSIAGQYSLDFDAEGFVSEDVSREQLLEMLKADAGLSA